MESLPLFPGLFEEAPPAGARRTRRGKGRAEATAAAAAVVEDFLPAEGSGPVAAEPASVMDLGFDPRPDAIHLVAEPPPVAPRRSDEKLLIFDVETTGKDRRRDQVIELCMQRGLSGTDYKIWRFKPTVSIHPKAQKVHGISMEQLADCPPFASCIDEIVAWFAAAEVIVGYNLAFDVDFLQSELQRAGRPPLVLDDKRVVDPLRLWQRCEPRKLTNAHQRFVGHEFDAAHSAAADVAATGRVLEGMLASFGLDDRDWTDLEKICDPERERWIGPTKHVQWEEDAAGIVLAFGKHEGMSLVEVARGEQASYLRWVCDHDFPAHVVEICERAIDLAREPETFLAWVRGRFGDPPAPSATGASAPTATNVIAVTVPGTIAAAAG